MELEVSCLPHRKSTGWRSSWPGLSLQIVAVLLFPTCVDHVPRSPHRSDKFAGLSIVNLFPEMSDVDVHDIRDSVEALVPDMLDNHVA
jgi:hypothetical protein